MTFPILPDPIDLRPSTLAFRENSPLSVLRLPLALIVLFA